MNKKRSVFTLFFLLVTFYSFASSTKAEIQKDSLKNNSAHILKFDLYKSAWTQLHVDYEWYNGRKGGWEVGFSYWYPDRVLAFVNQSTDHTDHKAFLYHGYGVELRRKFYLGAKHICPYVAPEFFYKYKYFIREEVLFSGSRGSDYGIFNTFSYNTQRVGVDIVGGFRTPLKRHFTLDVSAGLGYANYTNNVILYDTGRHNINDAGPPHESYNSVYFQFGIKLGYGFTTKRN